MIAKVKIHKDLVKVIQPNEKYSFTPEGDYHVVDFLNPIPDCLTGAISLDVNITNPLADVISLKTIEVELI